MFYEFVMTCLFIFQMPQDPIDCLEKRIISLEQNIYGQNMDFSDIKSPIIDSLIQSNMITSSALSGRDKLGSIVKRLDLLEKVLDPLYEDCIIDSVAKIEYILSMEDELQKVVQSLNRVSELVPILENDQLKNIPNLTKQISHLTMLTLETKKSQDSVSENINELISKYTDILNGLTTLFATLETAVTEFEIQAQPKKVVE